MADQLRWWKLWETALGDEHLANLSMEDCWRWAVLGVLLRVHGEGGAATWPRPARALSRAWRTTWPRLPEIAGRLPNLEVRATPDAISIRMLKWRKYQEDSSVARTKAWRDRQRQRDGQQTVTGDGHPASPVTVQTRRDGTPLPPSSQRRDQHPPRPTYAGATAPPDAWRHDCPDPRWHGRCVSRAYAAAHPDADLPVLPDGHGGYVVRECPEHRAQETGA